MDLSFLYGAAGGGVVGVFAMMLGAGAIFYFKRLLSERDKLLERQSIALERKVDDTARKLDEHIKSDVSQTILTKLEEMEKMAVERQRQTDGKLEVLSAKVDRSLQINEGQERDIKNHQNFIENLREDLQTHVNFCNSGRSRK